MAKPATRHRDGMEGHTECGKPLDQPGLVCQPVDGSGDPVTCGSCIKRLTDRCHTCKEMVVGVRREFFDRAMGDNITYLALYCTVCGHRLNNGYRVGERERNRQHRRANKVKAEHRKANASETNRRWKEELAEEKAVLAEFGLDMDCCAICAAPVSDSVMRHQWDQTLPANYRFTDGGWRRSIHEITRFVYCPEHLEVGLALDETLTATFRSVAADVRSSVVERMARAAR